ncbi:hypothetical protein OXX80_004673 [Metschnikowia pulcherrima]
MAKGPLKEYLKGLPGHKILRQIARLNLISGDATTAYRFPSNIKKVEIISMKKAINRRFVGLNQFRKWNLPTLKFHNDDVDFVVTRVSPVSPSEYPKVPCVVRVHKDGGEVKDIDCDGTGHGGILKKLIAATNAERVPHDENPAIPLPKVRLQ